MGDLLSEGTGNLGFPRPQGYQLLWLNLLCRQDGGREGRARHARKALCPPGFSCHWGPLDAAASLLPEAEADKQPPGPLWPCKNGTAVLRASPGAVFLVDGWGKDMENPLPGFPAPGFGTCQVPCGKEPRV